MLIDWNYRWRRATAGRRQLPAIVIPGAQKAGTTSLAQMLYQHPQVDRPAKKEIGFLLQAKDPVPDQLDYRFYMPLKRSQLLGVDASPDYMNYPQFAARLKALNPSAKLIILLRNPVDRLLSHYDHNRRFAREPLTLPEALEAEALRCSLDYVDLDTSHRDYVKTYSHYCYYERGLYAQQLEWIYEHFPAEQVLVIFAESFFADPLSAYQQVLAFLGLPDFRPKDTRPKNEGQPQTMDPGLREKLVARYAGPVKELEQLLGEKSPWTDWP